MVEEERYCIDVVTQITAIEAMATVTRLLAAAEPLGGPS
jgi:DNA-binding FrmR family transcriptional regulator